MIFFILFERKNIFCVSSDYQQFKIKADTPQQLAMLFWGFIHSQRWIKKIYFECARDSRGKKQFIRGILHEIFWISGIEFTEIKFFDYRIEDAPENIKVLIEGWEKNMQKVALNIDKIRKEG